MLWVGLRLRVAGRAGENGVVGGIGMTIAAELRRVVRDREPSVIEGRSSPACGRVTSSASGGEACSHVIRVRGPGVVRFVTRVTVGRCSRKLTIDVTAAAWNGYMRSSQGKSRTGVIESAVGPFDCVVAGRARRWKTRRHMTWICRCRVICLVTRVAVGRRSRKLTIDVTAAAWNGYMRSRERENCFRMIEDRVGPFDRVVANRTICGEPGGNVARIGRRLEIRLVAGITVRRGARELPVDVAAGTGDSQVRACQRKTSEFRMVESRSHPARGRVARAAIVREVCRDVTGIGCSIEIRRVAAVAVHRQSLEFPADVARNTVEFCVHAGQCEACDRRVIEGSAQPVVRAVTRFASCGEVQGLVIDYAGGA